MIHSAASSPFPSPTFGNEPEQPAVVVVAPVVKGEFSLADRWKGMDAHPSGAVFARVSRDMSCYTEQVFDIATADFEVFFDVRELHDGLAVLGVVKDGNTMDACSRHPVGALELESSVGIGIERLHAFIFAKGNKLDAQQFDSTGSTLLGMKVHEGSIKFSINGEPFESTTSASSHAKCLSGMFRAAVSFNRADQKGMFSTKSSRRSDDDDEEIKALRCRDEKPLVRSESEFPYVEWTFGAKFTFFDYVRDVDVVGEDQRELRFISPMKSLNRCTVFSNEVFDIETANFHETVSFRGGALAGVVCVGLVGENPTVHAADYYCGEVELKSSIGLFFRHDTASVLYKDKMHDLRDWPTAQDFSVTIRIRDGQLTFDVDKQRFSSDFLSILNKKATESRTALSTFTYDAAADEHLLVKGKFRLAISLSYPGQVASFDLERTRATKTSTLGTPRANASLTLQDQPSSLLGDVAISSLRRASTSAELKTAVDALPQSQACFSAEILGVLLEKQNLINDPSCANAVASFLRDLSDSDHCHLLRTAEARDLIIDILASKNCDSASVKKLLEAICNVVDDQSVTELYANRKSLSAIRECLHRAGRISLHGDEPLSELLNLAARPKRRESSGPSKDLLMNAIVSTNNLRTL